MFGVNVDPLNPAGAPTVDQLSHIGCRWVRLVSRPGVEQYVADIQAGGLMVLAVVARESNGYVFGGPDVWQFGNEPDVVSEASWNMSPAEYAGTFNFYQATYPQLTWIAAGLASGQTSYWQQVVLQGLNNVTGFAVHPYAKTAPEARALLQAYLRITPSLPCWATEWNRPAMEIPGFASMLRQTVAMSCWFCWSDGMVPGFGLTDSISRQLNAAS